MSCFTRGYVVKKFGLDDLFIAIAVTLGAAQTVTIILQIEHGQGRHASELHVEQFDEMLMVCSTHLVTLDLVLTVD
ncbi:hypothetical protein J4E83_000127 [Alternaria metachromatica]|uniref:uncharacterized protein n=1 Tax=Alternaria metachromatica TaxID=283354 RepID=UPI0020C1DDCD|nr:uncharacterized protein J4E83_000127 [Alternaria metachromatica]XP_049203745.1 uncharacterized protein J4E93_001839 [Alternaria ventricosa]KAI4637312.1 hypothetical protein J4E83_000127 [Alternaria metachromatica]KAI4654070.1 hypothetical protein J4E93_001839 [Alternaria ventricosa]